MQFVETYITTLIEPKSNPKTDWRAITKRHLQILCGSPVKELALTRDIHLFYNDKGKELGFEPNMVYRKSGQDIILYGNVLFVGYDYREKVYTDLIGDQVNYIANYYYHHLVKDE